MVEFRYAIGVLNAISSSPRQVAKGDAMVEQLRLVFDAMGIDWVLWLLLVLSVMSLGIAGERWWYFRKESSPLDALQEALKKALGGSPEALNDLRGLEAEVLKEALSHQHMGAEALEEIVSASLSQEQRNSTRDWGSWARSAITRHSLGYSVPFWELSVPSIR